MDWDKAAAALFPSHNPPPPNNAANVGGTLLGNVGVEAASPPKSAPPASPPTTEPARSNAAPANDKPAEKLPATALFQESPPELKEVIWDEPQPSDAMSIAASTWIPSDLVADEADVQAAREALVAVGAGATQARAVFAIANENARNPHQLSDAEVVEQLRQEYGDKTDEKLAAARALVAEAAKKWPGLIDYLESSRLGSSPKLIRALVAKAERRKTVLGGA